jgi:hypothetical protein
MLLVASFENVSTRIFDGSIIFDKFLTFSTIVKVLPVPAPAKITQGPFVLFMACCWLSVNGIRF